MWSKTIDIKYAHACKVKINVLYNSPFAVTSKNV